jgi:Zn-dependent protease with chaperone function
MDFFQAQDNALRNTKRLIFYYAVAVILIVIAVYLAVTAGVFTYANLMREASQSPATIAFDSGVSWWDSSRFVLTVLGVVVVVGLGSLYKTLSLRSGGSAVATSLGGERVDRSTRDHKRRQLLNVVEEMAIASGVPVPEVYILNQEQSINAFAAGWGRDDAVIAVSAGALENLSRDELQGVVAHEYSHVLYGDCRLNIRLMGVLFGIMMLSVFGRLMSGIFRGGRGFIYVGGGRRRSSGGGGRKGNGGALIIAVIVVIILVTIIGYIGAFFGRLIQAAISRQREYLADAAAVQFTRNPEGIAGALKKIGGHVEHGVLEHPSAAEAAHMFFADGLKRGFSSALATHPPLDERIRQIQPNWDGKYERSEPARKAVPPPETKAATDRESAGRRMIEGMAVLGAIGTMSRENIATARQITSRIPESIDEATREFSEARKTITALVMADNTLDDEAQLKLVQSALSPEDAGRVRELYDIVKELPRDSRLAVLELATTTLAQASAPGRADFLSLLNNLIQVDEKLSLYEFCIRRILRERLNRNDREPSAETRVQYTQLKPVVANAVGHLLSVVAREASGEAGAERLLAQALTPLYLLNGKVSYQTEADSPVGKLDHSLNILRTSAFAIRAQCLRAAVHCIQADGKLSPEEAELLRMLSLSLDCPAPPLGIQTG